MKLDGKHDIKEMPHISTPDSLTNQNMWAFFFTEIQRIHTEELNPVRLKAFKFNADVLLNYRAILKTLYQMFAGFLYKDFISEKVELDKLFDQFQHYWNEAEKIKKSPDAGLGRSKLNGLYAKCLRSLELIDNMLEVIRQKKGFGVTEQVSFVINERASKALRINDGIGKDILKIFKRSEKKRKKDAGLSAVSEEISKELGEVKEDELE